MTKNIIKEGNPTLSPEKKLRQTTEKHIEEWTKGMVHTAATQSILDLILQEKTWVTVTGSPGEGKTTAAYLALKKLQNMGRQIYEIRTPDDYFKVKDSNGPVLMFNDILGSNQFSQDNLEKWRPAITDILAMKEHRDLKNLALGKEDSTFACQKQPMCVVFVSRSTVLNSAACHLDRFKDYIFESVVNLTDDIEISPQERFDIWKCHADMYNVNIDEKTVMDVCRMPLSHGFPHCCRLFAGMYAINKNLSMKLFFSKPIEFLHKSMESLLDDSRSGPLLREMLKHDGCLQLDSITDDERRYQYKTVVERLKGTYLSEENDTVRFHHPSIYDSAAFVVCRKDPLFVIRYCSLSFINERVRFQGLQPKEEEKLGTLLIDSKYINSFIEKLKTELPDGISQVLSHSSFHDQGFVEKFMKDIQSDSHSQSEADFINELINKIDKKGNHSFLFYSTKNKSDKLLKYICHKISLPLQKKTDALFGICEYSSVSSMMFLLKQDGNIPLDVKDENLCTPLLVASSKSSSEVLKLLMEKGADVTARDKEGNSVLYHICVNGIDGDGDVVKMLIDRGVDVNWQSENYLIITTKGGYVNIITALIDKGANVNQRDEYSRSSLHYACLMGYSNIVRILCEKGVVVNMADKDGTVPFHCACVAGHVNIVTALLNKGVDINNTGNHGMTALHAACVGGHVNVLKALFDRGVNINQKDNNGSTAVHYACAGGYVNVLISLLHRGFDINQTDNNGVTALHAACAEGYINLVTTLLDRGVDINQTNNDGSTALHFACKGGHVNVMITLLDRGIDINKKNIYDSTALHAASLGGHVKIMIALLDRGVDINQANKKGITAFHSASIGGHVNVMITLLDRGVDINQPSNNGTSALHYACQGGHVDVLTALLDKGVHVNQTDNNGCTGLHYACGKGHVNVVTFLLARDVDTKQTDKNGKTALHYACLTGHVNVMTALLDTGVNMNQADNNGNTGLHYACLARHVNVITALLDRGVDINQTDNNGSTGLHVACQGGHHNVIAALLDRGADVNKTDKNGKTPFNL